MAFYTKVFVIVLFNLPKILALRVSLGKTGKSIVNKIYIYMKGKGKVYSLLTKNQITGACAPQTSLGEIKIASLRSLFIIS